MFMFGCGSYDGNNYFKLCDICAAIDFGVDNTIVIDTWGKNFRIPPSVEAGEFSLNIC